MIIYHNGKFAFSLSYIFILISQIEMSEIRSIIMGATSKSLVLIDEICRGTETAKGTCIAGSVIETLDATGCLGIVSTHLHGIFDLPLRTKHAVYKAMGSECIDGQTIPTWKLIDGICKESLAFETAQREGIPKPLIQRAEELYRSVYAKDPLRTYQPKTKHFTASTDVHVSDKASRRQSDDAEKDVRPLTESLNPVEKLRIEVENAVISICQKRLTELYRKKNALELPAMKCVLVAAREQPPPSTIGNSTVYVILRPDKNLYVGEVFVFHLCSGFQFGKVKLVDKKYDFFYLHFKQIYDFHLIFNFRLMI